MANNPTWIAVVAGAIGDEHGRLLVQRRPPGKPHAGLWEFPGGKVEPGETPRAALARELAEELGIEVPPGELRACAFAESEPGPHGPGIVILLYRVPVFAGVPAPADGCEIDWLTPAEIAGLPLPPLDAQLVRALIPPER